MSWHKLKNSKAYPLLFKMSRLHEFMLQYSTVLMNTNIFFIYTSFPWLFLNKLFVLIYQVVVLFVHPIIESYCEEKNPNYTLEDRVLKWIKMFMNISSLMWEKTYLYSIKQTSQVHS